MKIGIISDTHVKTVDEVPNVIRKALADFDIIIHAGNFTQKAVFDGLRTIGPVKAVYGNMDSVEKNLNGEVLCGKAKKFFRRIISNSV